ncbi:MAG: HEAT repeat domain-containing protein [Polyangiaceae bacterium]
MYFDLADLLMTRGQAEEADRLYRRVIRGAPDEELVSRAARLAIQINLGRGTLESLEQDLLPLAIGNPQKAIYRRLLMEVYGSLTFGLVEASRHESRGAKEARDALARIGARAVKPLLDALASGDAGQQRIAIDVLSHVENKNAAPALFAFATGTGDLDLARAPLIACRNAEEPRDARALRSAPPPQGTLRRRNADRPGGRGRRVLARQARRQAHPPRAARPHEARDAADACLRGARHRGPGSERDQRSPRARALRRGPATWRAPRRRTRSASSRPTPRPSALVAVAQSESSLARALALVALGRIGAQKSSVGAMTSALFEPTIEGRGALGSIVPRAATAGLVLLANPGLAKRFPSPLSSVETTLEVEELMGALVPRDFTEAERARAVLTYGDAISDAAIAALRTSGERAHAVLDAVGRGDGALRPFFGAESGPTLEPARERARAIAKALTPAAVGLVRHPDAALRTKALTLLASGTTDEATGAVLRAVEDQNESVQRMALAAVGAQASRAAVQACARVLETSESWAIRVLAADALGRLGAKGSREAAEPLARAATRDSYALVREAALRGLTFDPNVLARVIREVEASDPEPRVREAAESLARGGAKSSKTSPP